MSSMIDCGGDRVARHTEDVIQLKSTFTCFRRERSEYSSERDGLQQLNCIKYYVVVKVVVHQLHHQSGIRQHVDLTHIIQQHRSMLICSSIFLLVRLLELMQLNVCIWAAVTSHIHEQTQHLYTERTHHVESNVIVFKCNNKSSNNMFSASQRDDTIKTKHFIKIRQLLHDHVASMI